MNERLDREKHYYDELVTERSYQRRLLDRFSEGFYEKGRRGRLWSSFWDTAQLRGATVLDYGCGEGGFSEMLADLGADVCGIDISPGLIGMANKLTAKNRNGSGGSFRFMVCDAHRTPFPDNSFDYVLGNGALHHLDLDKAYAEIARILKPGGKSRFIEPMYHHPMLWSLRKLTPASHTIDERPLTIPDIEKARRWFGAVDHREHFLLSVCAAPAHLLGKEFALSLIDRLDRMDEQLMNLQPRLRKFAWYTVLELTK